MKVHSDKKPNKLVHETSPYLLQHAYNPVDWQPWGGEALQEAKDKDKPIIVSIGYAACHWCHVMERESFENEAVAALMNELFVCIKVDREERPDVDHIYMDAVQAITGQGGWPLNMFLTPDGKPFHGGTYFPPTDVHGRPSWTNLIKSVHHTFVTNRAGVDDQADRLTSYLSNSDNNLVAATVVQVPVGETLFTGADADKVFDELQRHFDKHNGGFGNAPKFPHTLNIQYLLRYHYHTKNEAALQHALLSLDKMIYGGIYDQLGGGFARYSTDAEWLAPHFEKMLYDNAQLVSAMSEAYQITGNELYKETVAHTLAFIERELMSKEGGFYAALDADSEGVEGKFYVWSKADVDEILGKDAALFCEYYDITEQGNWEESNILRVNEPLEAFAQRKNIDKKTLKATLAKGRELLLKQRAGRIRPGLDDKTLLGWNTLMCSGYIKACHAFGNKQYLAIAQKNLAFLLANFLVVENGTTTLYHTYKNGAAKYPAFLDDYACLIEALLDVYGACFDEQLLAVAEQLTDTVIQDFRDTDTGQFFFTPAYQTDIIVRKKDLFDSVTPSGNSTMVICLQRLAIITGRQDYTDIEFRMMQGIKSSMLNYGTSFTKWAAAMLNHIYPFKEIAVLSPAYLSISQNLSKKFIPNSLMMAADDDESMYPLLHARFKDGKTLIYLCENNTCQAPFSSLNELFSAIGVKP